MHNMQLLRSGRRLCACVPRRSRMVSLRCCKGVCQRPDPTPDARCPQGRMFVMHRRVLHARSCVPSHRGHLWRRRGPSPNTCFRNMRVQIRIPRHPPSSLVHVHCVCSRSRSPRGRVHHVRSSVPGQRPLFLEHTYAPHAMWVSARVPRNPRRTVPHVHIRTLWTSMRTVSLHMHVPGWRMRVGRHRRRCGVLVSRGDNPCVAWEPGVRMQGLQPAPRNAHEVFAVSNVPRPFSLCRSSQRDRPLCNMRMRRGVCASTSTQPRPHEMRVARRGRHVQPGRPGQDGAREPHASQSVWKWHRACDSRGHGWPRHDHNGMHQAHGSTHVQGGSFHALAPAQEADLSRCAVSSPKNTKNRLCLGIHVQRTCLSDYTKTLVVILEPNTRQLPLRPVSSVGRASHV